MHKANSEYIMKGEHMNKILSLFVVMLMTFMLFTVAGFAAVPEDMDFHKAAMSVDEVVTAAIADMIRLEAAALMDFKSLKDGNHKPTYNFIEIVYLFDNYSGKHATACAELSGGIGHKIDFTTIQMTYDRADTFRVNTLRTGKGVARISGFTEPVGLLIT